MFDKKCVALLLAGVKNHKKPNCHSNFISNLKQSTKFLNNLVPKTTSVTAFPRHYEFTHSLVHRDCESLTLSHTHSSIYSRTLTHVK